MKKFLRYSGIILFAIMLILSMNACSNDDGADLVGKWYINQEVFPEYNERPYYEFTSDGIMYQDGSFIGDYKVKSNVITVKLFLFSSKATYSVNGNVLDIKPSNMLGDAVFTSGQYYRR